ncbi:hypothetical protein P9112_011587 [Eukaryota sp. TZLM1-RC]
MVKSKSFLLILNHLLTDDGHAGAINNLGRCYHRGLGVTILKLQDYSQAVFYYQKAAEVGNEVGMYNLGLCYEHGHGVPNDLHQAIKCYEKDKHAGYPKAGEKIEVYLIFGCQISGREKNFHLIKKISNF